MRHGLLLLVLCVAGCAERSYEGKIIKGCARAHAGYVSFGRSGAMKDMICDSITVEDH